MDLRNEVVSYVEKNNLDDFQIIRYIYLTVCREFSYDVRFIYGNESLKREIANKKIDISNVQEYEIVCYTYCHILVELLALFNINAEIEREDSHGVFKHAYVIVRHNGQVLKLDPTKQHDTTRVKMDTETYGFRSLIDDPIFSDRLEEADSILNYDTSLDIDSTHIFNRKYMTEIVNVMEKDAVDRKLTPEELFFEKWDIIIGMTNLNDEFKRYDDIDYYFSYLLKKFKMNDKKSYIKPSVLFKVDDNQMRDIINIILVEYDNFPTLFYIMEKDEGHYKIRKSNNVEILEKLDEYSNWKVDYFLRQKAENKKQYIY